ncbi:MAG: Methionyl-tRNA formyltransferase [Candidatus Jettenia ecosi]|uniref:Methionyl-tRNA formyltransferase n=1 Tax=Candidatus Jettenia ecosi TaxID=2494326 RepID=A0A533Q9B2_9BACT|nr:MAG: Methionyl-tRNA formyltransferase [Candidatus Jettenia ecosi]
MNEEHQSKFNSKNPLKIGYFADGKWAHEAFKLLIKDDSIAIQFICLRHDTQDKILEQLAKQHKINCFIHRDVNSFEFIEKIKPYKCDLFVSMSFNQIFKPEIINLPEMKTINCHAGKLPFYRGRNVLNWVLINGEKEFGITVHYVDDGIDTGDIILQRTYSITDEDNYQTLLEKAYVGCAKVLHEAVKLLQVGKVESIKQADIHPVGFYCPQRKDGDEIIDWNQTSYEIFNFVRAICKPGPMARSFINGKEIKINKVKIIPEYPVYKSIPGAVVGIDKEGFFVKTKESVIKITEWEYDGKIKIGDRLK